MEAYSLEESTEYYTLYQRVPIEQCADDFLTVDEVNELPSSIRFGSTYSGRIGVMNKPVLDSLVNQIVTTFADRKEGRKTAKFDMPDLQDDVVINYVKCALDDHGIKVVSGRIWPIAEKVEKIRKDHVRKAVVHLLERYLTNHWNLPFKIEKIGLKNNQIYCVLFAAYQLKLTLKNLLDWKSTQSIWTTYGSSLKSEEQIEYAQDWWEDVVAGKVVPTEKK